MITWFNSAKNVNYMVLSFLISILSKYLFIYLLQDLIIYYCQVEIITILISGKMTKIKIKKKYKKLITTTTTIIIIMFKIRLKFFHMAPLNRKFSS